MTLSANCVMGGHTRATKHGLSLQLPMIELLGPTCISGFFLNIFYLLKNKTLVSVCVIVYLYAHVHVSVYMPSHLDM